MEGRKTNFLVTLVFDENLHIGNQIDTEYSFRNEITKELQHLVKDKEIKHFIVADDEVINNKLKEEPKTGYWIGGKIIDGEWKDYITPLKDGFVTGSCSCSECGEWLTASDEYTCYGNYCPNCGAKMESEE